MNSKKSVTQIFKIFSRAGRPHKKSFQKTFFTSKKVDVNFSTRGESLSPCFCSTDPAVHAQLTAPRPNQNDPELTENVRFKRTGTLYSEIRVPSATGDSAPQRTTGGSCTPQGCYRKPATRAGPCHGGFCNAPSSVGPYLAAFKTGF